MKRPHYYLSSPGNYLKALARLEKSIQSGEFARYTQQKKWQIWNRLCRYARQLGIQIKASVTAACLAAGLSFVTPATAQTFVQQTGTANPFNLVNVGYKSAPAFVDIDGDGDKDAFIGSGNGTISYYKNTGTVSAPIYIVQPGTNNPLNGVNINGISIPAFVDIDGDGDMDLFVGGDYYGTIVYYKNTGTTLAPTFTPTPLANPLNSINEAYYSVPAFVDIDGDGDMDLFLGLGDGTIRYYKNTGSATVPIFTEQLTTANPFNLVDVGDYAAPTFIDIDGDGDKDAFIGENNGKIIYYKNTGTPFLPTFTLQPDPGNPLSSVNDPGGSSTPAFVDIDGDGDMDVFIGSYDGGISYYKNNTIVLPLHLLSFSGSRQMGYNKLQWQTTSEINTRQFELEAGTDGRSFIKIASINATHNLNNNYGITDKAVYSGKVFYRLKMVDADSRFTYSSIIWINTQQAGGVSIYPNPVTGIININIGNARILKTNAGIYDVKGRLLQVNLINSDQQQINVESLAKGVYIIKFTDGTAQNFIKE